MRHTIPQITRTNEDVFRDQHVDVKTRDPEHYGIEHFALDTDDYSGTMARLKDNAQIELIEKVA